MLTVPSASQPWTMAEQSKLEWSFTPSLSYLRAVSLSPTWKLLQPILQVPSVIQGDVSKILCMAAWYSKHSAYASCTKV